MPASNLARLVRHHILVSTTAAGSGHPSSSLSAADLMTALMFGGTFRFDLSNPGYPNNDRLIFSKGHAAPLFYALWAAAGAVSAEELMKLRQFDSPLEGHPTMRFRYTEAATGSLGQGLSIGVGMAMNAKYLDKLPYRTYVLLGDSEMAEGSVWEAMASAAHYRLNNLVAILDVNRLGQRGETMHGHDIKAYARKAKAFGWDAITIDGHRLEACNQAFAQALAAKDRPVMIIAKTLKGKGVSLMENKDNWHGRALKAEELEQALREIGPVTETLRGRIAKPLARTPKTYTPAAKTEPIGPGPMSTRKAYGQALVNIHHDFPDMVVLDAETSNSTYAEFFKKAYPDRFLEMYIAEQNMVGAALGLSRRGKIPFVSTFAAFLTRTFDQIRMSQYSHANIKFVGSHAGGSIGEDGSSQMALEDIAMMRSVQNCAVLYPSDAVSTEHLVRAAAAHQGSVYLRTTRMDTPVLYTKRDKFKIGGSQVLRRSPHDAVTVVGAGITLHEALRAQAELKKENIAIRVIDLYSVKPLDTATLQKAAAETKALVVVEDHYAQGGIGEAVTAAVAGAGTPVYSLAVTREPRSGKPQELLDYESISAKSIIETVRKIVE